MKIKNAIIILGPGKSGTTLLNDMLSHHPSFYWISNYTNKNPNLHFLSIFNNIYKSPALARKIVKLPKYPRACEPFLFFSHFINEFHRNQNDFSNEDIKELQKAIVKINQYHHGKYFLTKFTGPPRLEFIEKIFDKPFIIWLDRDPRAIIASFYKSKWRYKNNLELFNRKNSQEIIKEYVDYYKYLDREKEKLNKLNFNTLHYEDLVNNPEIFIKELLQKREINYPNSYQRIIKSWKIKKNQNDSYKTLFTKEDIELIDSILK